MTIENDLSLFSLIFLCCLKKKYNTGVFCSNVIGMFVGETA